MSDLTRAIEDLVAANRILAAEGVVDAFGHVSVRHPTDPKRFLLSRARAPELVEPDDVMEFTLQGEAIDARGRTPYLERFIHGALFEARPDVASVVHNHSLSVIPYGMGDERLKPVMHMTAAIGPEVPVWDSQTKFGDTDLLVSDMAMGRDLAQTVGKGPTSLMRGHGCVVASRSIRKAVYTAVYLEVNAALQMQASRFKSAKFLTPGEVKKINDADSDFGINRAWERWCRRADVPFRANDR
jgi:ribulose-5-phosphate 4-epimerase/fuculose-1-phosphate aldolase